MIVIPISATIIIISIAFLYFLYRSIFYSGKNKRMTKPYDGLSSPFISDRRDFVKTEIDTLCAAPCEEIQTKSHDGLSLFARYYKGSKDQPICIVFHGYKGSSYTEPSGISNILLSHGIGVLITDHRAHGYSEGSSISFGINERRDCQSWCNFIKERFGEEKKIILYGISMGASTVLMASELTMPNGFCGVIADCPYSSAGKIIKRVLSHRHLPSKVIYPAVWLSAILFGRFNLNKASPVSAAKKSTKPLLLIHGTADNFVPLSMSEEIYKAYSAEKSFLKISDAKHAGGFAKDPEKYSREVLNFIEKLTK